MFIIVLLYSLLIIIAISYSFPKNTIANNLYFTKMHIFILSILSFYVVYITDIYHIDRLVYTRIFNELKYLSFFEFENQSSHELFFNLFIFLVSEVTNNIIIFYLLLHLLFLIFLIMGLRKINGIYFTGVTLFIFMNTFFYYSYTLNGLRQGIAIVLIILVIGYLVNNKNAKAIITSVIAVFFHYSVIPVTFLAILIKYFESYIKLKHLIGLYVIISLLFIFDLQSILVGSLNIPYIEQYTSSSIIEYFGETNNINFLIFNTFFLILFYYIFKKHFRSDTTFKFLLKCYIIFSAFFLLFGFIAFSNRIAIYSWFLIPILLGYYINFSKNAMNKFFILVGIIIIGILTGVPEYFID